LKAFAVKKLGLVVVLENPDVIRFVVVVKEDVVGGVINK
jgi:hypothetical protein